MLHLRKKRRHLLKIAVGVQLCFQRKLMRAESKKSPRLRDRLHLLQHLNEAKTLPVVAIQIRVVVAVVVLLLEEAEEVVAVKLPSALIISD